MGKDKWAKVISYLRSSNRDPDKVLKLLKGNQKGKETNYDINRSSYALNIIAVITQKMRDPKNKGKTRAHIIRTWVKSDDFKKWDFSHSGLYLDFLAGNQSYKCTPWGNPTRNILIK